MSTPPVDLQNDPAEARARQRYMLMNAARILSLGAVIVGIAGARAAIAMPYPVGVVLAVGGMLSFFFTPTLLAKRWKAQDRAQETSR